MAENVPQAILPIIKLKNSRAFGEVDRQLRAGISPSQIAAEIQPEHFGNYSLPAVTRAVERLRLDLIDQVRQKYQVPQPRPDDARGADIQMMEKLYTAIVSRVEDGPRGYQPQGAGGDIKELRDLALCIRDYINLRVKTSFLNGRDPGQVVDEIQVRQRIQELALHHPSFGNVIGDPQKRHRVLETLRLAETIDDSVLERIIDQDQGELMAEDQPDQGDKAPPNPPGGQA